MKEVRRNFLRERSGRDVSCSQRKAVEMLARTFLVAGMIGASAVAKAQSVVPDSQVEAKVLKALAGESDLASRSISTDTVYGVVTLSGNVQTDDQRTKADNLAANAQGVRKVIDRLQVGAAAQAGGQAGQGQAGPDQGTAAGPGPGMVLQSDGTYAPALATTDGSGGSMNPSADSAAPVQAQRNDPENDQALDRQTEQQQAASGQGSSQPLTPQPGNAPTQPQYGANGGSPTYPQGNGPGGGQSYPNSPRNGYPAQPRYAAPWGGQVGGETVSVPAGTLVRVRVNRLIASDRAKAGDHFDGFVANDVVAGGFVAIPRGTSVQGTVVNAKGSGTISGRGELSIQLDTVTLGGKVYPVASDVWSHNGGDKTIQTVNSAAGYGVLGALVGAAVGRGAGAAIGAGVGAAAGVGASAASPRGQVIIPPEGMVSFNLSQPVQITTVSEQEIQRLAYGVVPGRYPSEYPGPRRPIYGYPGYPAPYPPPAPYGYPPN